jgi:pimeloyl-ACP methyl ester carboxylesterase
MISVEKKFLSIGKEQIAYYKFSPQNPCKDIFFMHGAFIHIGVYESFLKAVSAELNVTIHATDLLGHGYSTGCVGDISVPDQMRTIIRVIKLLIRSKELSNEFYLMGHSLGGLMAMYLTKIFSKKIQGMILISPYFKPGEVSLKYTDLNYLGGYLLHGLYSVLRYIVPKGILVWNNISTKDIYPGEKARHLIVRRDADPLSTKIGSFIGIISLFDYTMNLKENCLDAVWKSKIKIGFLTGSLDRIMDLNTVDKWNTKLKSNLICMEGVGHELFIEDETGAVANIKKLFNELQH